jgi:D-arabinose 1-dehydrogenase-like Zn-dependent alcohol dehydrogenase
MIEDSLCMRLHAPGQSLRRDTDAVEFLALAPQAVKTVRIQTFALSEANDALDKLRRGDLVGAAVLDPWARRGRWPGRSRRVRPDETRSAL